MVVEVAYGPTIHVSRGMMQQKHGDSRKGVFKRVVRKESYGGDAEIRRGVNGEAVGKVLGDAERATNLWIVRRVEISTAVELHAISAIMSRKVGIYTPGPGG